MQYNDGNKARLREGEGVSLRGFYQVLEIIAAFENRQIERERETEKERERGEQYAYTWLSRGKLLLGWG